MSTDVGPFSTSSKDWWPLVRDADMTSADASSNVPTVATHEWSRCVSGKYVRMGKAVCVCCMSRSQSHWFRQKSCVSRAPMRWRDCSITTAFGGAPMIGRKRTMHYSRML